MKGAARRKALTLKNEDLQPFRGVPERRSDEGEILQRGAPADLERGINNLMTALETLRPPKVCRKGETMADFFETLKYQRRVGTRISDYITVFDQGVTRLIEDGVDFFRRLRCVGLFLPEAAQHV